MSDRYVSLAEVKELLTEEHQKRDLHTSQKAAMEHAMAISPLKTEQAKALMAEVLGVPGVTESVAVKIVDLLPQYPEDIRAILSKERVTLDATKTEMVIEIVGKYL